MTDDERRACVLDANVLLDLAHGRCLDLLAMPVYCFLVTPTARHEVRDVSDDALRANVAIIDLSGPDVAGAAAIRAERPGLSLADAESLVLCQRRGGALLTGDRALRTAAYTLGIPYHGVLWLLDQAIAAGQLAIPDAAASLERMLAAGARLPTAEVRARLQTWR